MTPEHIQKCHQKIEETKISGLMKRTEEKSFFFPKLNDKEFHHNCLSHRGKKKNTMKILRKRGKKAIFLR